MTAVVREDLSFLSNDGVSTCKGSLWHDPSVQPKAVVQLVHGMVEHISRYDEFAQKLVEHGYAACGIDHLGHGNTTANPDERGVFDPQHGADYLIEDQYSLRLDAEKRFGSTPHIIFGHSMGSFITRCYIGRHAQDLAAAVIMGTGWLDKASLGALTSVTKGLSRIKGWSYRSKMVNNLGVGGYNKAFAREEGATGAEWLSRDRERVQQYLDDPDCGWIFSISGYYTLGKLMGEAQDRHAMEHIPSALPILIVSGGDDPVGVMGKGPAKLFKTLRELGCTRSELQIYEGARHELLNETNREQISNDLITWLDGVTAQSK